MKQDIDSCGALRAPAFVPACPTWLPLQCAAPSLDEHFYWHRIRRMPRK